MYIYSLYIYKDVLINLNHLVESAIYINERENVIMI